MEHVELRTRMEQEFIESDTFTGSKKDKVFKNDYLGLGYYYDIIKKQREENRKGDKKIDAIQLYYKISEHNDVPT